MESIGEKLKSARNNKKLSTKDVAEDTNIAVGYIEALEEEDFDRFPGETYVVGFLKSYSEYLKLDPEEMLHLYKGYKIGESATPIEELTKATKSGGLAIFSSFYEKNRNGFFLVLIFLALALIVGAVVMVVRSNISIAGNGSVKKLKADYEKQKNAKLKNIRTLQLSNDRGIILAYKGEAVQFLVDNREVVFVVKEVAAKQAEISFINSKESVKLKIGEELTVELPDISRNISLTLKGLTESRVKILVVLGERKKVEEKKVENSSSKVTPLREGDNTSVIAQDPKNLKIIFQVTFLKKSFIEIYLDGVKKQRGFMPAGSTYRWEATEHIQVKMGNAGGVKAKINGKVFALGGKNQVANKVITWKKDTQNPNLYHIVVRNW